MDINYKKLKVDINKELLPLVTGTNLKLKKISFYLTINKKIRKPVNVNKLLDDLYEVLYETEKAIALIECYTIMNFNVDNLGNCSVNIQKLKNQYFAIRNVLDSNLFK